MIALFSNHPDLISCLAQTRQFFRDRCIQTVVRSLVAHNARMILPDRQRRSSWL